MISNGNYMLPELLKKANVLALQVENDFSSYYPDYFRSLNSDKDIAFFSDFNGSEF